MASIGDEEQSSRSLLRKFRKQLQIHGKKIQEHYADHLRCIYMMEIEHFSCREGKLTLVDPSRCEEKKNITKSPTRLCRGCNEVISADSAYFYRVLSGNADYVYGSSEYALHKSCAELDHQIQITHPLHDQHELTLLPHLPDSSAFICDACGCYSKGFTYNCRCCQFNLDLTCASNREQEIVPPYEASYIKHFSHFHFLNRCYVRRLYEIDCHS